MSFGGLFHVLLLFFNVFLPSTNDRTLTESRANRRSDLQEHRSLEGVKKSLQLLVSKSSPPHSLWAKAFCHLLFRPAGAQRRKQVSLVEALLVLPKRCHLLSASALQWGMLSLTLEAIVSYPRVGILAEAILKLPIILRENVKGLRFSRALACGARCLKTGSRRDPNVTV